MTTTHRKRLQKLADFLKTVPPKQFDLCSILEGDPAKLGCGTFACAIGHCPIVFPRQWRFRGHCSVSLRKDGHTDWLYSTEEFFGLEVAQIDQIFTLHGYPNMAPVTPKMVARKIERFLEKAGAAK